MCLLFVFFFIKLRLLKNDEKCFLYYLKSSFCPRDFQILHCPLFSFLGHCWFYRRIWFTINSKVYRIIMSLNWNWKTYSFFTEKFNCPNTNFGPLHWQGDSLAYSMLINVFYLIWSKDHWEPWKEVGSQSLAKYIIRVWTKNLSIRSWRNGLWLRCWISNRWISSSKSLVGSKFGSFFHPSAVNEMSTRYF